VIYRKPKMIKATYNVTDRLNTVVQMLGADSLVLHPDMNW